MAVSDDFRVQPFLFLFESKINFLFPIKLSFSDIWSGRCPLCMVVCTASPKQERGDQINGRPSYNI